MIFVVATVSTIVDKKHVDAIKNGWSLGQSIIHLRVHSYFPLPCYNVDSTGIAIIEIMIQVHIHIVSGEGITFGKDMYVFQKYCFLPCLSQTICPLLSEYISQSVFLYTSTGKSKKNLHLFYVNTAYY